MPAHVNDLQRYAIAFVVIGVVLAVGLSVLAGVETTMTLTESVVDEDHQPATPFPTNITVDEASDTAFIEVATGSETLEFYDATEDTFTTLSSGTDYVAFYEEGRFELQDSDTLAAYDEAEGDEIIVSYDAVMEDTDARDGASSAIAGLQTFAEWLPLLALVIVAIVVVSLVSLFRNGRNGRRGRA